MTKKKKKTLSVTQLKQQVRQELPTILTQALSVYNQVTTCQIEDDAKQLAVLTSAAKNALAHVEAVVRLAQWLGVENQEENQDNVTQLIKAARHIISLENGNDNDNVFEQ